MKAARLTAAVVVSGALAVTGCGGSSKKKSTTPQSSNSTPTTTTTPSTSTTPSQPSDAAFKAKVDPVCQKGVEQVNRFFKGAVALRSSTDAQSAKLKRAATLFGDLHGDLITLHDKLAALKPPASVASNYNGYVASVGRFAQLATQGETALKKHDQAGYAAINAKIQSEVAQSNQLADKVPALGICRHG